MIELYRATLPVIEQVFRGLERRVDPPELRQMGRAVVYRYRSESLEAALIQKLARVVSGLNASLVLLERGLLQELGAVQRMLDEFCEDIQFLSAPLLGGERTRLHEEYLRYFYQEEEVVGPNGRLVQSDHTRPQSPRKKVQAAIARGFDNPSEGQELFRSLSRTYGGFVHGASPHIMELYDGDLSRFRVEGMLGTHMVRAFTETLWPYFSRAIVCALLVALAFKDADESTRLRALQLDFMKKLPKNADGEASRLVTPLESSPEQ